MRVVVRGNLDGGVFKLQLDVGIDDAVVPDPEWVDYPTLLGMDAPRIFAYRPATALAEKLETIVSKGITNSRLKDYYDIWLLSTLHEYDGTELGAAARATFEHRGTQLPTDTPPGLTDSFFGSAETQARWRSLLSSKGIDAPSSLPEVCESIVRFIMPPVAAAAGGELLSATWEPGEGWI